MDDQEGVERIVEKFRAKVVHSMKVDRLLDAMLAKDSWSDDELDQLHDAIVGRGAWSGSREECRRNTRWTLSQGFGRPRVEKRLRANLNPAQGTWPWGF